MTFDVEIVLREHNEATTERLRHDGNDAPRWTEEDVEMVLKSILLAINRARNPLAADTFVAVRGFSWIVETPPAASRPQPKRIAITSD